MGQVAAVALGADQHIFFLCDFGDLAADIITVLDFFLRQLIGVTGAPNAQRADTQALGGSDIRPDILGLILDDIKIGAVGAAGKSGILGQFPDAIDVCKIILGSVDITAPFDTGKTVILGKFDDFFHT